MLLPFLLENIGTKVVLNNSIFYGFLGKIVLLDITFGYLSVPFWHLTEAFERFEDSNF